MSGVGRKRFPECVRALPSELPLAVLLDLFLGEPPAPLHPVVRIGAAIDALERWAPAPERRIGIAYGAAAALALAGLSGGVALAADRAARRLPLLVRAAVLGAALKPAFALRMLLDSAQLVRASLETGDLEEARDRLRSLVSRDASQLSLEECAAAAIESLAENLTDSIIGPWLGYALAGLPGAWIFRTINTLDSRWGYHGRYEYLGRVAARLDDVLAWVPARVSAILLIVAAPAGGGSISQAWRLMRCDHARTESPNAGWTMSAMAGALDRRLEKRGHYLLNAAAPQCGPEDIRRAERITEGAAILGLLGMIGIQHMSRRRARRAV